MSWSSIFNKELSISTKDGCVWINENEGEIRWLSQLAQRG
jgi:hypothetical protein